MSVLPACMCIHPVCAGCPWKVLDPLTGFPDGSELALWVLGTEHGSSKEQQVFITAESSFLPRV